ncbi:MAG: hypothetical protein H6Q72_996 [Firmicutes bacterium]|nr:hypothetical protein [Bacillota bacterium]
MVELFAKFLGQIKVLLADKKRKRYILFAGIILITAILILDLPDSTPASNHIEKEVKKQEKAKTQFHEGPVDLPPRGAKRDPFEPPPEITAAQVNKLPASLLPDKLQGQTTAVPRLQEKGPAKEELPILTGIVGDEKTQAAIIAYKGVSRSYRVGQTIGQYQLTAINEKAVNVVGPQGERVLLLGR